MVLNIGCVSMNEIEKLEDIIKEERDIFDNIWDLE